MSGWNHLFEWEKWLSLISLSFRTWCRICFNVFNSMDFCFHKNDKYQDFCFHRNDKYRYSCLRSNDKYRDFCFRRNDKYRDFCLRRNDKYRDFCFRRNDKYRDFCFRRKDKGLFITEMILKISVPGSKRVVIFLPVLRNIFHYLWFMDKKIK